MGRADAVATRLKSAGINARKILTIGKGSSEVIDSGDTEDSHAKNRRVVIRILGDKRRDQLAEKVMNFERGFASSKSP